MVPWPLILILIEATGLNRRNPFQRRFPKKAAAIEKSTEKLKQKMCKMCGFSNHMQPLQLLR